MLSFRGMVPGVVGKCDHLNFGRCIELCNRMEDSECTVQSMSSEYDGASAEVSGGNHKKSLKVLTIEEYYKGHGAIGY